MCLRKYVKHTGKTFVGGCVVTTHVTAAQVAVVGRMIQEWLQECFQESREWYQVWTAKAVYTQGQDGKRNVDSSKQVETIKQLYCRFCLDPRSHCLTDQQSHGYILESDLS